MSQKKTFLFTVFVILITEIGTEIIYYFINTDSVLIRMLIYAGFFGLWIGVFFLLNFFFNKKNPPANSESDSSANNSLDPSPE
jgi:FtsH-binding integral membrane protein